MQTFFLPFAIFFWQVTTGEAEDFLFQKKSGFRKSEDSEIFTSVSSEQVREYWDTRPCNSGWSFEGIDFGSKEHWDAVKKKKYFVEYHIPEFAEFDRWRGKKVLEIGGGICTTATSFAEAGANITVVELSSKSMELCRQRFSILGLSDRATFYISNAENLSSVVPIDTYDLIWSFGVIHHSPNPNLIVAQIHQYMGPTSILKLMVYSKISFKLFWVFNHTSQWNFAQMDEVVAHYSEAREGSPVTYTYSHSGFLTLLQAEGLEVEWMGKAHIFPFDIAAYKRNRYVVDPLWHGLTSGRWGELEEELGWHLLAQARLPGADPPHGGRCPAARRGGDAAGEGGFPGVRGRLPCGGAAAC